MARDQPRRSKYVVTVVSQGKETREDVDRRLADLLGIRADSNDVTLTGYDAIKDLFYKILS